MNWNTRLNWLAVAALVVIVIIRLMHLQMEIETDRARECSRLLHGVDNATLTPVHNDARIEVGACLLQFNQQIRGE